MEELLKIAESSSPLPIRKIIDFISKRNVELVNLPQEKIDDSISVIFDFISQNPAAFKQADWDKIRFLLVIMIISLFPMQSSIPPIIINTNYGPLFSILLVLHELRKDHSDSIPQYVQACNNGLETFNNGFGVKTFYSITHCYYLQALPLLLKNNLKPEHFTELLNRFFASISRVKPESLNINFISFSSDMFRQIAFHIVKNNLQDISINFAQAFKEMLDICSSCPNIILLNLLYPWYAFFQKQCNISYNFQDQIEILTLCYEKVASGKYHELHRGFPWYIAIYFFSLAKGREQQTRVLLLICHAFRSIPRLDAMKGVPDATKEIYSLMINQQDSEGLWALFHILTSCESTISLGISDIKKIRGICIKPNCTPNQIKRRTIKFSEQSFEEETNNEIDTELSTKIEELQFPDYQSAKECFDKQVELLSSYRTRLMTVITFQFVFVDSFLKELQNEDNFTSSVAFYYVTKLIRLGIKIMIISSQRITMLEQFHYNEILMNQKDPFQPSTNSSFSQKTSFSIICRRYMELTGQIPMQYYSILAKEIAQMLYKALEKGQISFLFIKYFSYLENINFNSTDSSGSTTATSASGCNSNIQPQDTLYAHVLCQLFEIASTHLNDFLSHSASKSKLIFNLILFIIRIGKPKDDPYCHPCLKLFLKTFYKLIFTTIISNIKKTSNQVYALKVLRIYLHVMNGECNRNKNFKLRSVQRIYDEIQLFAKKDSLSPLLLITIPENDAVNVPSLLLLLEASLNMDDDVELNKSASDFCLSLFNPEKQIDSNNNATLQLFESWFKSIVKLPDSEILKIIEYLPEYSACFNQPLIPPTRANSSLIHNETGFDLMSILNEVAFNMNDDSDEVANLFALIVDCFDILKEKIHSKEAELIEPMRKLILFLCYCSNFDYLKDKVITFSKDLIEYFVDLYAKGDSSLFLIALISISGRYRSESSKFATYLCISFLEKAIEKNVSVEIFKSTIDEMMSYFNPQMRFLSMLCGLSLFTRFVPESISLQAMRFFFISSNEFYVFEIEFTTTLNKMLKEFLKSQTREEQTEFVYMSYDILSHTLLNCSLILLKRLSKLEISLPIHDCNEIMENNEGDNNGCPVEPLIVFQKLSAILMCGIEGEIILSEKMKQMIHSFITSKNDALNLVELSRKMSLYISIIRSPETYKVLSSDPGFVKNVLSFFVNTLSSRYSIMRKNAAKAFRTLVTKYNDDFYSSRQIEMYCSNPSKIFIFFSPLPDRIAFYRRLTKIIPHKIPPSIAQEFLDSIFEYVEFNDSKKFSLLSNLIHFVKYLTIEKFIRLDAVQAIILSPYKDETKEMTYLEVFIEKILILYQHREVPYHSILHKHVIRFLKMFPNETVSFIVQVPSKIDQKAGYDFLADLIENDHDCLFFDTFVQYVETNREVIFSYNHPSIFNALQKLSKIPYFAQLDKFQLMLDNLLYSFIHNAVYAEASKRDSRIYTTIIEIAYSELNTFKVNPSIERLFKFTRIFNLPSMTNTHLYHRYVTIIFKKSDQKFILEIVKTMMENKPKISPKSFEILLGHSLKYLQTVDKETLKILWEFLSHKIEPKQTSLTAAILICIIRLISKYSPPKEALKKIFENLQWTISSPDTHIVIYSIKLSIELVKHNLMTSQFYYQIVKQLFSYSKFFDLPYSKFTYEFLKMSSKYRFESKEMENDVVETISFFPHDKFNSIREMKRFIDIFTEVPQFLIGLPFSLTGALSMYLEANLRQRKPKDDIIDVEPLFIAGLKFCSTVKPSRVEIDRFIETCFKFFHFLILNQLLAREFPDIFFEYILTNGCSKFPVDMLPEICQNSALNKTAYQFEFICSASKFAPDEVCKNEYIEVIANCLQYAADHQMAVNNLSLVALLEFINSKSGLRSNFHQIICNIVDSVIKSQALDEFMRDRFIIFCNGMISGCQNQLKLTYLVDIWRFAQSLPNVPSNRLSISSLFRFVMSSLIHLPIHQQLTYLDFMLENTVNSPRLCFLFISVLPILFDSESVSNQAKNCILTSLSDLFTKVSVKSFEDVIASVVNYGEKANVDHVIYVVSILLSQCKFCSHSNRLVYLRRIMELIPDVTFEQFISELPLVFWSNDYLSITTALITPDEWPIWCSIFAFSHCLSNISDQIAPCSFCHHIKEENYAAVVSFLSQILTANPHFMYSKVCISLLQCFYMKGVFVDTSIVEKAVKYHNYQAYLPHFLNDTIPSSFYLMPHILNDSIFGHFLTNLPAKEASAIALTFLNEYQAASAIYCDSYMDNHPLFPLVSEVNDHFLSIYNSSNQSLDSFLSPLVPISQENDSVLIKINEAVRMFLWKEEAALDVLYEAEMMNMKSLRKRRNLSLFEKERIATIEATIRVIKRHIQSLKSLHPPSEFMKAVSPVFAFSLRAVGSLLEGTSQIQIPAIVDDSNGCVLLEPSLSEDFPCVTMITSRNLLVLGKSQIDSYLFTMSLKISENQVTATDWCKFAHFCFNVFLAQPSLDLFQVTFGVYSQIIGISHSTEEEIRPFIKIEAPARIITLIRMVIESSDADMAMIVTSNSGVFKREFFDLWMPWLVQIIDLAKSNWFCSIVTELAKEAMYRSSLYCEKLGCKRMAESLNPRQDSDQPLLMMKSLEESFDEIFKLDFNAIYYDVVRKSKKEAVEFRNSGRFPSSFFEFAALQIDEEEYQQMDDDDQDERGQNEETNNRSSFNPYLVQERTFSDFEKMSQIVRNLNKVLPVTMPHSTLYKVYEDIRKISPELIVFHATTSNSYREAFLIQKSHNSDIGGYSTTIISLSNIASIFKRLFDSCYQSRIRSINLNVCQLFEVGHNYTVVPLGDFNNAISMSTIFSAKIKMTHKKWIDLKIDQEKVEEEWPFTSVKEMGIGQFQMATGIHHKMIDLSIPESVLLDYMSSVTSISEFIQIRQLLLRSFAAKSSIRYLFNAPYPKIERMLLMKSIISAPLLISDFEPRFFTDIQRSANTNSPFSASSSISSSMKEILENESTFRLSPNIAALFGPHYRGEFFMSFAAAMKSLTSRIEVVRACFEILVADPSTGNGGVNPENLLINRNRLEERLIEASPPTGTMVSEEDCVEWFSMLFNLIKKSENAEIQNPYAIPWF